MDECSKECYFPVSKEWCLGYSCIYLFSLSHLLRFLSHKTSILGSTPWGCYHYVLPRSVLLLNMHSLWLIRQHRFNNWGFEGQFLLVLILLHLRAILVCIIQRLSLLMIRMRKRIFDLVEAWCPSSESSTLDPHMSLSLKNLHYPLMHTQVEPATCRDGNIICRGWHCPSRVSNSYIWTLVDTGDWQYSSWLDWLVEKCRW